MKEAQNGGSGVVIYFRKEGRALGEVTKVCCSKFGLLEQNANSTVQYRMLNSRHCLLTPIRRGS